ncbi:hypothetical protein HDU91_007380 [Kappamyces sp. JEL0680]|nr:hypothetical protein HDU91_007380 [Kappamyces sp. JEL0680]
MGKTFEFQKDLKRLPIPSLANTAQVYLESCKPFYDSPQQEEEYTQIVRDFVKPGGLGETLQARLIAHDKTQPNSWLEKWWLNNWFVLAAPHPAASVESRFTEGYSDLQVSRAAGFTSSFLDFKDMLDREELAPEKTKGGYLDMYQYTRMFGITRVPKPECDILVGSHPAKAQHIIVLVKDQIFVVHVYDQHTGGRISIKEIERQFLDCIHRVHTGKKMQPPVCLLSGQHRDKWAEHHGHLLQLSPKNAESFRMIETALFAVALDHRIVPQGNTDLAKLVFHSYDGHNRWFDKSLTIVVSNDGRVGLNGEHSPCDALVPAIMVDYAVSREPAKDPLTIVEKPSVKPVQRLEWEIDDTIKAAFSEAQAYVNETIADSDVKVLHYKKYGSEFIKKVVSPDAYSQLCLQLTFYRIHGHCAGVYETASTRAFLHGRTETCRSLTPAALHFVKTFEDPRASVGCVL